jgi:hypothetical protein
MAGVTGGAKGGASSVDGTILIATDKKRRASTNEIVHRMRAPTLTYHQEDEEGTLAKYTRLLDTYGCLRPR